MAAWNLRTRRSQAATPSSVNDSIYVNGGSRSLLTVKKQGSGYVATIWMGVHA